MIVDCLFNQICPSSLFNDIKYSTYNSIHEVYVTYELNDIIMLVSLIRLFYLCKQYFSGSEFLCQRQMRIMILLGLDNNLDLFFAIRAYIATYPKWFLFLSLLWSQIIFSFMVINLERPISKISEHNSLDSWQNCLWFCIVTQTTVGYGDRTPVTQPARAVVFILMIWGFLWNAIFISTLFPLITITETERKALNMFTRTQKRDQLMGVCSRVVVRCLRIQHCLTKIKIKKRIVNVLQAQIITILRKVRSYRRELNS